MLFNFKINPISVALKLEEIDILGEFRVLHLSNLLMFVCRSTKWSSCYSSSGTIHGCVTVTDHVTNFWTQSTTIAISGSQTRTSSCTETSRIPLFRSTLPCGSTAMAPSTIWCGTRTIIEFEISLIMRLDTFIQCCLSSKRICSFCQSFC